MIDGSRLGVPPAIGRRCQRAQQDAGRSEPEGRHRVEPVLDHGKNFRRQRQETSYAVAAIVMRLSLSWWWWTVGRSPALALSEVQRRARLTDGPEPPHCASFCASSARAGRRRDISRARQEVFLDFLSGYFGFCRSFMRLFPLSFMFFFFRVAWALVWQAVSLRCRGLVRRGRTCRRHVPRNQQQDKKSALDHADPSLMTQKKRSTNRNRDWR